MKICNTCHVEKPLSEYHKHSSKAKENNEKGDSYVDV
jgi:hypothetical protein